MLAALIVADLTLLVLTFLVGFLLRKYLNSQNEVEYYKNREHSLEQSYDRLNAEYFQLSRDKANMEKALANAHVSLELVLRELPKKDEMTIIQNITGVVDPDQIALDLEGKNLG